MDREQAFAQLGTAIRNSRERQGLTQPQLADRVRDQGGSVTIRSIQSLEKGTVPRRRDKLPSTEPVVAALGWRPGWADRILAGEAPADVLDSGDSIDLGPATARLTREGLLEMLPAVYAFSRGVVALGGDTRLRDEFDRLVDQLVASVPQSQSQTFGLAAYRPHVEGEGAAVDDAHRIARALDGE